MKESTKSRESRAETHALSFSFPKANLTLSTKRSKSKEKNLSKEKTNLGDTYNLDYLENKCNRYKASAEGCGKGGVVVSLNRKQEKWEQFAAFKMKCKTLICEECSKRRRARIARHIRYFLQMFPDTHMLTLTLRSNSHKTGEITKYWLRLRARLWKVGIKFKFFLVRELTKAGTEHLHILISRRLNISLVRKMWHEITGDSYVVHIKRADEGAVQYLSKYLSKNQKHWRIIIIKRIRLYSYSKGLTIGQYTVLRVGTFVGAYDSFEEAVKVAEELEQESYLEYASRLDMSPLPTIDDPLPF